jgi:hypothetical protein
MTTAHPFMDARAIAEEQERAGLRALAGGGWSA